MKRILWLCLCLAALLLTACGQKTAAQAEPSADPAVAAAQLYQPLVQAVGNGTDTGVDLVDAQIAQAVTQLSSAGLTAVHVDAAGPVTHPEAVTAFWDARTAGQTAEVTLYEVCRDGGLLCRYRKCRLCQSPTMRWNTGNRRTYPERWWRCLRLRSGK